MTQQWSPSRGKQTVSFPAPNLILKVIPCQPLSLSVSLNFLNHEIHLPTATNISWGSSASSPIPTAWIRDDRRLCTQNATTQAWKTQRRAPMPLPGQASQCPLIHMRSHLWPRPPPPTPAGRQILKSVQRRSPEGPSKKVPPEEQPWGSWAPGPAVHGREATARSWKQELPEAVRTPRRPWGWGGVGR